MADENATHDTMWREVGDQFQTLGENIAGALRATWEREETHQHVRELQTGLEGLARHVGQAIDEFAGSSEGRRVQAEAKQAAESARSAGEKAWQDAQPHILSALRQVNAELEKISARFEATPSAGDATPGEEG
jgi:nuclear transport factor 2 (NTF2) superfamily protein